METKERNRWRVEGNAIVWDVANDSGLPHEDHIEMSGRKVSVIVRYRVDENRRLFLTREVIWPTLRTREGDVRGYLKRTYEGLIQLPVFVNEETWTPGKVSQIRFDGTLIIHFDTTLEVQCTAVIWPEGNSVETCLLLEKWLAGILVGVGTTEGSEADNTENDSGVYGTYGISIRAGVEPISTGQVYAINEHITATSDNEDKYEPTSWRSERVQELSSRLVLETPDEAINTAFSFAKLRAAESLFETKMGLVHSPGGGRYYGGVWNNDQCEYSGPFFGYLGDPDAQRAALTAYRNFAPYMTAGYDPIPTSLEMEGTIPIHAGGDRGDAAMYASGAARFALTTGDLAIAEELTHHIEWCLEYCDRKRNAAGVVESDCDELEHRFPAGDANLSTNCLYYDGLRRMADLARDLSRFEDAEVFDLKAVELARTIEKHFGATVEGYETYRYYEGNMALRAWICLPLAFGVGSDLPEADYVEHPAPNRSRIAGTLDALFSPRLWGPDGLATEAGKPDFWDRSTLYALRGAFFAGDTERAWTHLSDYTRRRLLGEHVPYPVEAYPEGGQAHLSAESALYCRVIVEGMFGLVPTGLRSFRLTPRLPAEWQKISLRGVQAFGHNFNVEVTREEESLAISVVSNDGKPLCSVRTAAGTPVKIELPA